MTISAEWLLIPLVLIAVGSAFSLYIILHPFLDRAVIWWFKRHYGLSEDQIAELGEDK